jgi:uncharacterized protein DUF1707
MAGEVTPRGSGDEQLPAREFRASYEDRDRVVETLRLAAGDGRLTADELDQRIEMALTARTYGELAALTKDLPDPAGAAMAEPKDLIRIDVTSARARRDGHWMVPRRMEVKIGSGGVKLDFTEAVITQATLRIDVEVNSGWLLLITKPGIVVDADDISVRSGSVKVEPPGEAPTVLKIQVAGKVGSGRVKARPPRPPRRTFWQWLLHRPKPALPSR